jgi:hypothetical protein
MAFGTVYHICLQAYMDLLWRYLSVVRVSKRSAIADGIKDEIVYSV